MQLKNCSKSETDSEVKENEISSKLERTGMLTAWLYQDYLTGLRFQLQLLGGGQIKESLQYLNWAKLPCTQEPKRSEQKTDPRIDSKSLLNLLLSSCSSPEGPLAFQQMAPLRHAVINDIQVYIQL